MNAITYIYRYFTVNIFHILILFVIDLISTNFIILQRTSQRLFSSVWNVIEFSARFRFLTLGVAEF